MNRMNLGLCRVGGIVWGLVIGVAVIAAQEACAWSWPQCRNTSGGSPEQPSSIYLGDTGTFGCDSWGTTDGAWGKHRVVIHTAAAIASGSYGSWSGYDNADHNTGTSPRFTATGTWYWGMQVEYTDAGGTTGWYCRNDANWNNMYGVPDANLTITVNALNNPSISSATTNPAAATSEIKLQWSKDAQSHNVMIVRKLSSASWTEPTQGTAYSVGADIGSGKVVYNGADTAYTNTGLASDTSYDYKFYSENNSYYSAGVTTNGIITMATEPTSAATSMTFGSVTPSGMTVGWTRGNGSNVLVVCQAGSAPSDPGDLVGYTANAAFGSGTAIGSGYVVYKGSGTSVAVSGLTSDTTYYFAVYEFNGSNATNYLTSSPAAGSQLTPLAAPTTPSSTLQFTGIGPTSALVSWTQGDGGNRIVVAKAGTPVDWTPSDNNDYAANSSYSTAADLGSGNKVVYNGSGNSFTLSGLSSETAYHLKVFEYNGSGATAIYLTSGAPVSNVTTWAAEPTTAPSGLSFTGVSKTGFTVNWAGNGDGASVMAIVRQGGAVNAFPSDTTPYTADPTFTSGSQLGTGNYVVYSGAGSSVLVTGLTVNTSYSVAILGFNGSGVTLNYKTNAFLSGSQATLDNESVILRSPASIAVTAMVGTAPASQAFSVTNAGGSLLSYTITTNAAWLSVTPAGGSSLAANAGQSHTAAFTVTGLGAGTHNGTVTITSTGSGQDAATNSPQTIDVALTLTNIPGITSQTATVDGKELVHLSWANAGLNVLVVHKTDSASTAPTQGTGYSVGNACGGGTVIYSGSGTSLEHVVTPGAVNHYAFYSINNNHYSAGVTATATMGSYGSDPTEVVEPFAYVTGESLAGKGGGNGFGGTWSESNAGSFTVSGGSFGTVVGYPVNAGNKIKVTPPDPGSRTALRPLASTVNGGKLYVSFMMNVLYSGATKYAGLQFVDGTTEKAFFGEISSQDQQLGVSDGSTDTGSAFGLNAGVGNDYVVFGMYDFASQTLKVKGYYKTATIPATEPTWDATKSAAITQITGIRLVAGAASGTPGDVYFDEIRVATNWAGLLNLASSVPPPAAASATASGKEFVQLSWTPTNALEVLVVGSTGGALTDPTAGQSYAVGAACGGGTVLYKGVATSLEHVVTPGTTNTYRFFSNNGSDLYSTGLAVSVTMPLYGSTEIVEPFAYTNGSVLNGLYGGHGWSGAWSEGNSGSFTADQGSFGNVAGYASNAANKILVTPPAGNNRFAYRSFPTVTAGKVYVSFLMNYEFAGPTKFAGVSFMDGGAEKAFFGEIGSADQTLGVSDGSTDTASSFALNAAVGNDYVVVGLYDFGTGTLKVKGYWKADTLPVTEPTMWDATKSVSIGQITGIRLGAGAVSGTPGRTFFDEIRVATNWADVVNTLAPATQASQIQFSQVRSWSMNVSWTRGNGASCLVVASEDAPLSGMPSDEVNYTASATYGSGTAVGNGYVVYKGSGTSVAVTNLAMSTTYHFRVFELNGGDDAVRFNTASATGNPASQATLMSGAVFVFK